MKTSILNTIIKITSLGVFSLLMNIEISNPSSVPATNETKLVSEYEDCYSDISYEGDIKIILNKSCALSNCHVTGSTMKGDFSSYHSTIEYLKSSTVFEDRVFKNKDMPPFYSPGPKTLEEQDLEKILSWIKQGYLK
jgi:hypothetical protein